MTKTLKLLWLVVASFVLTLASASPSTYARYAQRATGTFDSADQVMPRAEVAFSKAEKIASVNQGAPKRIKRLSSGAGASVDRSAAIALNSTASVGYRESLGSRETGNEIYADTCGRFNKRAAKGLNVIYQLDLSGDNGGKWQVIINNGTCEVKEGPAKSPNITFSMTTEYYLDMISGKLNGQVAFMSGRMRIAGDMGLALRMESLFSESEESAPLYWNAWEESSEPLTFTPLPAVAPGAEFVFVLDLSSIVYGTPETQGASSQKLPGDIRAWLERWVKSASPDVDLDVLIIPDRYFIDSPPLQTTMKVNLVRLRQALAIPAPTGDYYARLRAGDNSLQFGHITMPLRARPSQAGLASIALSLWDRAGHPIGELEALICINNDSNHCAVNGTLKPGIYEGETLTSSLDASAGPDAALQFMQLRSQSDVIGVFRERNVPLHKSTIWHLNTSAGSLSKSLTNLIPDFFSAVDDSALKIVGGRLYNLLFPEAAPGGRQAGTAFREFFSRHPANLVTATTSVPSIYVRLIQDSPDPPLLFPLALMAVPMSHTSDFLGNHLLVETPLELQSYTLQKKCISKWVFMMPPDKPRLAGALEAAYKKLSAGPPNGFGKLVEWRKNQTPRISGPDDLRKLLSGKLTDSSNTPVSIDTPVNLIIVSHQQNDKLYFHEGELGVTATDITSNLPNQSAAIIAGCSTQGPGALDLVRQLNLHGVSALIGTASNVGGDIAGDFLDCFGQIVNEVPHDSGLSYADAYSKALVCLRTRSSAAGDPYGDKSLVFSLAGNGAIPICSPSTEKNGKVDGP
jgi:putative sterol carrier protein